MTAFVNDLIFIHIPKTGGTSIRHWLVDNCSAISHKSTKHLNLSEVETFFNRKFEYSFAVVRNPWDRALSTYFYQLNFFKHRLEILHAGTAKLNKAKWSKQYIQKNYELYSKGFEYFLDHILPNIVNSERVAFKQTFFTGGVTKVLKLENINQEFKLIQDKFNCYNNLPRHNVSKHNLYDTYYTSSKLIDQVSKIYSEDINTFGYKFNDRS